MAADDTSFTVTVSLGLTGKQLFFLTSSNAGSLYIRSVKQEAQSRLGLPSPFSVHILIGTETVDDFAHLHECTAANELHLQVIVRRRRRPTPVENEALAEAIGLNLPLFF